MIYENNFFNVNKRVNYESCYLGERRIGVKVRRVQVKQAATGAQNPSLLPSWLFIFNLRFLLLIRKINKISCYCVGKYMSFILKISFLSFCLSFLNNSCI